MQSVYFHTTLPAVRWSKLGRGRPRVVKCGKTASNLQPSLNLMSFCFNRINLSSAYIIKYVKYSFNCVSYIKNCKLNSLWLVCSAPLKTLFLCVRVFVVQQIPDSNLLMLVVQADCDCSRQYPPITMEPREVKYILAIMLYWATGVLSHKNGGYQGSPPSCRCFSLTPSHIMPRLNVTGWGHRRFADGPSRAMPTTPRLASQSLMSQSYC